MGNNYKQAKKVLLIILFANILAAVLKIAAGSFINSTSMIADGFHSLTDGSSNIIGLTGIWLASKPVDLDHPYGHGKFETLAGLFISCMLVLISGKIIIDAISRFINPAVPQISLESLIILVATLLMNIFICIFEYRKGRQLNCQILISDSIHTRSDVFISIGVLLALICIKIGMPAVIDPIISLIVSVFILHAAYGILKSTCGILLDKAAADTQRIKEIAMSFEQVEDVHKIRSRGSERDLHIDMHIMTSPDMNVDVSHALIHEIEDKIRSELCKNAQVIIHIEPYYNSSLPHSN
jgi:cation diffusion facilitator family transporter